MTEEQYEDFRLMLKGCGAGLPMYSTLNRFERAWFSSIIEILTEKDKQIESAKEVFADNERLLFENADLKKQIEELKKQLYSDNRNVFAELNDETAQSNE